jgi:hypothetical protein
MNLRKYLRKRPAVPTDVPNNIYQRTLVLLDQYGWTQGINQDSAGHICLGEAVARVVKNTPNQRNSNSGDSKVDQTFKKFADRLRTAGIITYPGLGIIGWNDDYGRTYEQVQNALRVASAQCVAEGVTV